MCRCVCVCLGKYIMDTGVGRALFHVTIDQFLSHIPSMLNSGSVPNHRWDLITGV